MKRIRIEVCPQKRAAKHWKVTKAGVAYAQHDRQADAISTAVNLAWVLVAQGWWVTLKIKRRDGTIRDERTYPRSSDPRRSKG